MFKLKLAKYLIVLILAFLKILNDLSLFFIISRVVLFGLG